MRNESRASRRVDASTRRMVSVGVIGVGHWGPNLIRNFHTHKGSCVRMCADLSEERRKLVEEKYPDVKVTDSAEEVLADPNIDAAIISTPTSTHYELSKRALLNGKHVFVEKPLATESAQCEELIDLAQRKSRVLFVGHVFVYNAGIQAVKKYLDGGDLGRIYYIQVTRTNLGPVRHDVSALWDLAPHDLSILHYWFNETPVKVSAVGGRYLSAQREDVVFATYLFGNGALANVHVSWLNPKKVREIVVVGEKRMLVWDDMDLASPLQVYDKTVQVDHAEDLADTFLGFRATILEGERRTPKIKLNEPLFAECEAFLKTLRHPEASLSTGQHGKAVVDVLLATVESLQHRGREVEI